MGKTFQRRDRDDKDWYITFYEPDGTRIKRRIGPSKKTAETILKKIEVEIAEGRYLSIKKDIRVLFEDFLDEFYQLHCKSLKSCEKTHRTYRNHFKEVFKGKFLDEIKVVDIERYKLERSSKLDQATVNRYLSFLRTLFNKAISWDKFSGKNPFNKIRLYKENNARLRYLEKDEIKRLLLNCQGQLKAIVGVALNTGMRREEIFSLKWQDIDFHVRIIYVRKRKGGEPLEVPINDEVFKILKASPRNPTSDFVFWKKNGEKHGDIRKSFWTALRLSDIKDFHFHDLRHTFASQLVMSGVDLNTVRELLGHKSLDMTLRYAHLSPGHKRRAVDILGHNITSSGPQRRDNLVPIWSPEGHLENRQKPRSLQSIEKHTVV